jgi:hypothetical protein
MTDAPGLLEEAPGFAMVCRMLWRVAALAWFAMVCRTL